MQNVVFDGSVFKEAVLKNASFDRSSVIQVDFTDADIKGANFTGTSMKKVRGINKAINADKALGL